MANTFAARPLAGERSLITGTDDQGVAHKVVLDSSEFLARKFNHQVDLAQEDFDAKVEAFYAPIIEAAEAIGQQLEPTRDPAFYDVISEEVEGVEGQRERVIHLRQDTVILNMIESGNTDRLVWIDDSIEIYEYSVPELVVEATRD